MIERIALAALGAIFAWSAYRYGGVVPEDWNPSLLGIGAVSAFYALTQRRFRFTGEPKAVTLLALAFLGIAVLQILPLPLTWLGALSPHRAELHGAVARLADAGARPVLSTTPQTTLQHALTITALILVFLLVRELGRHWSENRFVLAVPLLLVGTLEGVLGVVQWQVGTTDGVSTGTYASRNHYAGLLELCLPFALLWAAAVVKRGNTRHESPGRPAVLACAGLAAACVMLLGTLLSLSRMGFLAVLAGLLVMGLALLAGVVNSRFRWALGIAACVLVVSGFVFLPTDALIGRFATISSSEEITSDMRTQIWRESIALVEDYPLLGCGLGSYESCFHKYKTVAPMLSMNFAHNDYLQLMAETGLIGFIVFLLIGVLTFLSALRQSLDVKSGENRYVAVACLGALASIGLHSFVDFNLYVPANTMALAWVAGMVFGRNGMR